MRWENRLTASSHAILGPWAVVLDDRMVLVTLVMKMKRFLYVFMLFWMFFSTNGAQIVGFWTGLELEGAWVPSYCVELGMKLARDGSVERDLTSGNVGN